MVSTPTLRVPREERSVVAGAVARELFVTVTVTAVVMRPEAYFVPIFGPIAEIRIATSPTGFGVFGG